ncbi:MAG: hypothetical protein AAGI06_03650 [Pseudomonadota bacterium]
MKKTLISSCVAAAFAMSTIAPAALAHGPGHRNHHNHNHHHWEKHRQEHPEHHHKHSDTGVAIAVGAIALIAAAAAAKSHENSDVYHRHHGHSAKDNAIAACLHRAQRRTAKRGGYGVTVKRLNEARRVPEGWSISLRIKQRTGSGTRNRYANCIVAGHSVISFNWA